MVIRGVLIKDGTIQEVRLMDELGTYYATLGCDLIDIVRRKIKGKDFAIVCDEEGLYKENSHISMMDSRYQTPLLVGNLFICNMGQRGNLKSLTESDVELVKSAWKFRTIWGSY